MDKASVKYFYTRNDQKVKIIRSLVKDWQMSAHLSTRLDTMDVFDKLFSTHARNKNLHRLKSLYSYDVRDSERFKNIFIVERKIKEWKAKK